MAARIAGDLKRQRSYVAGGVIKIGDFVMLNSAGQVVVATASASLQGLAMSYCKQAGDQVLVADHPEQEILISRSATAPSAQTDYNLNYNIVANTTAGVEGNHTLDSATGATTATLPLRANQAGRSVLSASEVVVRINNHSDRPGQVGI